MLLRLRSFRARSALEGGCMNCIYTDPPGEIFADPYGHSFCIGCDKWKGLNSFSKAQRRTPDKAKWSVLSQANDSDIADLSHSMFSWPCMQEQLNTEPGASSDDDDSAASNSDSDSDYSITGGTTLGGMSNLTISNAATSETGGVTLASPTASKASTSTPPHLRKVKASPSVNTGNSNFAKVRAVKRPVDMDAVRRERERERELDLDEVEVASSESDDSD